ncbi:hypothetical protein WJX73_007956 [Symbiochloris irregularis]|uniref:Uncharacterized protein n=1 Tax=Symbiochloris irregularis TaxID=706552 RepID=A0AAW1NMX8_9CHLO
MRQLCEVGSQLARIEAAEDREQQHRAYESEFKVAACLQASPSFRECFGLRQEEGQHILQKQTCCIVSHFRLPCAPFSSKVKLGPLAWDLWGQSPPF